MSKGVKSNRESPLCDGLIAAIRTKVRQDFRSLSEFARHIGRRTSTVSGLYSDDWNPTLDTLRDCETILNDEEEERIDGGAQKSGLGTGARATAQE